MADQKPAGQAPAGAPRKQLPQLPRRRRARRDETLMPADYVKAPRRWPDGELDEESARTDGRLMLLQMLADAALTVRTARGNFTQESVSLRAGLNKNAVNELERGTTYPDVETLARLFEVLGVTVEIKAPD